MARGATGATVHRHPVRWILGMGGGGDACSWFPHCCCCRSSIPRTLRKRTPDEWALTPEEEEKVEGMEAMNRLLTQQPEALQIFRAYAHASLVEDVVPLIKDGRNA